MDHFHEVPFVRETWDIRSPLCEWLRRDPAIHTANVQRRGEGMRLEWVQDSDFRFFPIVQDELFGDMPNVIDIGTN